jgi:hypothetical protein
LDLAGNGQRADVAASTVQAIWKALDLTQPGLPMKKNCNAPMARNYKLSKTTTLFAALNVLDGAINGHNMQRHRH